jgi:hypothetical protein
MKFTSGQKVRVLSRDELFDKKIHRESSQFKGDYPENFVSTIQDSTIHKGLNLYLLASATRSWIHEDLLTHEIVPHTIENSLDNILSLLSK